MKSEWGGQGRDFLTRVGLKSRPPERGLALGWGFIIHQEWDTGRGEDRLLLPPVSAGKTCCDVQVPVPLGPCARVALKRVLVV